MTDHRWLRQVLVALYFLAAGNARADDWPQWMGPDRNGVWNESGVVKSISNKKPPVKWRVPIQHGYGGPAVVGDRVFVMDFAARSGEVQNSPDGRVELKGQERILCFSAHSGEPLWDHAYDRDYKLSYPGGPRCTPTVADGKVFTLGAEGDLVCLDVTTGNKIWSKQLTKEYKTDTPIWGFASHPLVVGDVLFCLAGGEGSVAVALDKNSGREIWRALSAPEPGYCPPSIINHAGRQQLIIWHPKSLNGMNPMTGEVYWSLPVEPSYGMSIMAPQKLGDHLYASAIGNVSALIKLDNNRPDAEIVWRGQVKDSVFSSNSTPLLHDGMIYGCDVESGALVGARLSDGKRLWQTTEPTGGARRDRHATAFLVRNGDRYYLFNEQGDLIVARLTPESYEELGKVHVLEPTNEAFGRAVVWSHPAYAQKCMFARNDRELVCVDLAVK